MTALVFSLMQNVSFRAHAQDLEEILAHQNFAAAQRENEDPHFRQLVEQGS
jgi:hypothetical protein